MSLHLLMWLRWLLMIWRRRSLLRVGVFIALAIAAQPAVGTYPPVDRGHRSASEAAQPDEGHRTVASSTSRPSSQRTVRQDRPVSVVRYGAEGDGVADDTTAIDRAMHVAARTRRPVHFPKGVYRLTAGIDVPAGVRRVGLADGAVLRQESDDHVLRKQGRVGREHEIIDGTGRGSRVVRVGKGSTIHRGAWVYLGSDDVIHDSKDYKKGFLRQVTGVRAGGLLMLDKPLHTTMEDSPRLWEIAMAPPVTISGGVVEHARPRMNFQPLIVLDLVRQPRLRGVEVRNGGASGIRTIGTYGGRFDVYVHDLLDDFAGKRYGEGNHYGYGIEVAGATRALVVRGRSHHVRHAFTTNGAYGAPDKRMRLMGEPENIAVTMEVENTTSVGLDTHEAGYDIRFVDCTVRQSGVYRRDGSDEGKERGFGVNIRSRRTSLSRTTVAGAFDDGVVVSAPGPGQEPWTHADRARLASVRVIGTRGERGMQMKQAASVQDFSVVGNHKIGIQVDASVTRSKIRDGRIDLGGHPGSWGIIAPESATVVRVDVDGAVKDRG